MPILEVPTMIARLVLSEAANKALKGTEYEVHKLPITDHPAVIQETSIGRVASLNVWCPGSPIAPPFREAITGEKEGRLVLDASCHEEQMHKMAEYIHQLLDSGVDLIALQGVPKLGTPEKSALVKKLIEINNTKEIRISFIKFF